LSLRSVYGSSLRLSDRETGLDIPQDEDGNFSVVEGQMVDIRQTNGDVLSGAAWIEIERAARNDDFEDAILLPSELHLEVPIEGRHATRETGEPLHGLDGAKQTHWWSWTAPKSRWMTVSGPSAVAVYVGDRVDRLSLISLPQEFVRVYESNPARGPFLADEGVTYYFAVEPSRGDEGNRFTIGTVYPESFDAWLDLYGLEHANPLADVDRDGSPSVLEYLANTPPDDRRSRSRPRLSWQGDHWVFSYLARPLPDDLQVVLERSDDLVEWRELVEGTDYELSESFRFQAHGRRWVLANFPLSEDRLIFVRMRLTLSE